MANPFQIKQLSVDAPFCNRVKEVFDLTRFAESRSNVVLHSPRRFGKTSLVRRVQNQLAENGAVTIYADFFGVGSVDDVAAWLAEAVFKATRGNESLWKKAIHFITSFRLVLRPDAGDVFEMSVEPSSAGRAGLPLLKETMEALGNFIESAGRLVHIVLDEFQEIMALPGTLQIEATLRANIQQHSASYFFVGSRRRLLLAIFNERHRPFFQSAYDYTLGPLPESELVEFLVSQFDENGVQCHKDVARELATVAHCHPYYTQKLAHYVFDLAGEKATSDIVQMAAQGLVSSERTAFEAIIQGLPPQQRLFLRAIAKERTKHPYSTGYARKHNLGSLKAIQNSVKQLELLDLIEKDNMEAWKIVDPIFAKWLSR